jgi:hypothetical protein
MSNDKYQEEATKGLRSARWLTNVATLYYLVVLIISLITLGICIWCLLGSTCQ